MHIEKVIGFDIKILNVEITPYGESLIVLQAEPAGVNLQTVTDLCKITPDMVITPLSEGMAYILGIADVSDAAQYMQVEIIKNIIEGGTNNELDYNIGN